MKTKCLNQIRSFAGVALMFIGALLTCYSATLSLHRGGIRQTEGIPDVFPSDDDGDAKYTEARREFMEQLFGTGREGVSISDYMAAAREARALPASPLLHGGGFAAPEGLQIAHTWNSPIAPPIQHSYGGNATARVQTLAIDPINSNVIYTGSFGGVAKTTDSGVTWRYLSDSWSSQSVSAIAVHPNASTNVYVGTGRDDYGPYGVGLYRSLDGGATWSSPLGSTPFAGTSIRNIAIDRNAGAGLNATVYVANGLSSTCGLWRSTNSGATWVRVREVPSNLGQNGIYDVAIDSSQQPSVLYVTEDDGTFKSTDSGKSWNFIHGVLAGSWNRLSTVNNVLYLLGPNDADHNLYKSQDHGKTWVQILTNCPAGATSCENRNTIGLGVFAVDPFNPNVILGGNKALYRTDNQGATWTEIEPWWGVNIHTDQKAIAFSPATPGVAYDGNDGGVVRSTNDGQNWTNLNQNFAGGLMYSVALSSDGSLIAGTQDNGAVYSSRGTQWYSFKDADSAHDLIDPIGSVWAYKVRNSRDSFCRFNRQIQPYQIDNISPTQLANDTGCGFFPVFNMNPASPTHVIAACQRVVRTLDAPTVKPESWTTIGQSLADPNRSYGNYITAAYQAPSNSNVIYVVRGWDTVFVTSNANQGNSATWVQVTQRNHPGGISSVTVDPINYQTAYLACNSGVYKTTDMGTTWVQQIPQQLQNLVYRDVAIDPANPHHIFAASNGGVFASADGGTTWGNMSDGIPAGLAVTGLSFNPISRQLAASTYGRGVYVASLTPVGF